MAVNYQTCYENHHIVFFSLRTALNAVRCATVD